ncbi:hypothetical protein HDU96_006357 [Phlyctochytrium bullatum]|nr:hypothetical protein HDU96_006357 [Phlyctochytrium bullatum]
MSSRNTSWSSVRALTLAVAAIVLQASITSAHGMFYSPNGRGGPGAGSTRGYSEIASNIDNLRAPSNGQPLCRGRGTSGSLVPVRFGPSGSTHTVTLAFSVGAQHPGPCTIEIINPQTNEVTLVGSSDSPGCAKPPLAQLDSNKQYDARSQCGGGMPERLRTNDMCLTYWTFTLQNVERIKCTTCIMRWYWVGTHISPPEVYENCVDISLSTPGGVVRNVAGLDAPVVVEQTVATVAVVQEATPAATAAAAAPEETPTNLFAALSLAMTRLLQRNQKL